MTQCIVRNGNLRYVRFAIIQLFLNVRVKIAELTTIRYSTSIVEGARKARGSRYVCSRRLNLRCWVSVREHGGMANNDIYQVFYEHNGVALGHCEEIRRSLALSARADS
jgi:hypothetical protein